MNLGMLESALANMANRMANNWVSAKWSRNPMASGVKADKATYVSLWEKTKGKVYPEIDQLEQGNKNAVNRDWLDELALHTQICIKNSELCYQHGRVVYSALATYLDNLQNTTNGITVLETGTARGFSATCMAKAMEDKGVFGNIFTFDLLPHKVPIYWNIIDDLEGKKSREQLLSPWSDLISQRVRFIQGDTRITLKAVNLARVNFAFLDGGHTYEHVRREFDLVQELQQSGDVIVFDDYTKGVFDGLIKAVDDGCIAFGYDKTVVQAHEGRGYVIAVKR